MGYAFLKLLSELVKLVVLACNVGRAIVLLQENILVRVAFISHSDHLLLHLLDLPVELADLRLNFLAHGELPVRGLAQNQVFLLYVLELFA